MNKTEVIESIRQVASTVLPQGSKLYLYGSRARGDAHEDSDWDLLLLLDKPQKESTDFDDEFWFINIKIVLISQEDCPRLLS